MDENIQPRIPPASDTEFKGAAQELARLLRCDIGERDELVKELAPYFEGEWARHASTMSDPNTVMAIRNQFYLKTAPDFGREPFIQALLRHEQHSRKRLILIICGYAMLVADPNVTRLYGQSLSAVTWQALNRLLPHGLSALLSLLSGFDIALLGAVAVMSLCVLRDWTLRKFPCRWIAAIPTCVVSGVVGCELAVTPWLALTCTFKFFRVSSGLSAFVEFFWALSILLASYLSLLCLGGEIIHAVWPGALRGESHSNKA